MFAGILNHYYSPRLIKTKEKQTETLPLSGVIPERLPSPVMYPGRKCFSSFKMSNARMLWGTRGGHYAISTLQLFTRAIFSPNGDTQFSGILTVLAKSPACDNRNKSPHQALPAKFQRIACPSLISQLHSTAEARGGDLQRICLFTLWLSAMTVALCLLTGCASLWRRPETGLTRLCPGGV